MRSLVLASVVALVLICHLADSATIKRAGRSDIAKYVEHAEELGGKLNNQKELTDMVSLLKAEISKKQVREIETCPSDEFIELDSDSFGIFLYPSNNPEDNNDNDDNDEDDEDDTTGQDEQADADDDENDEDDTTDEDEQPEDDNDENDEDDTTGEDEQADADDDENDEEDTTDEDEQPEDDNDENDEDDVLNDIASLFEEGVETDNAEENQEAGKYDELIELLRRNTQRKTTGKREKRSVKVNKHLSARGTNDARTDATCSHVIETTQSVITVIVLADTCQNGEVHLYNGKDNSDENPVTVPCGQTEPVILNTDGSVYVEYVHDSSAYHGGFGLLWIGSN